MRLAGYVNVLQLLVLTAVVSSVFYCLACMQEHNFRCIYLRFNTMYRCPLVKQTTILLFVSTSFIILLDYSVVSVRMEDNQLAVMIIHGKKTVQIHHQKPVIPGFGSN